LASVKTDYNGTHHLHLLHHQASPLMAMIDDNQIDLLW
jgi:hypothetical protein